TTLSILYIYEDPHAVLEYPETSADRIGYLFKRDPDDWEDPTSSFAYSLGHPCGQTQRGKAVECQGSKVCPRTDMEALSKPHTIATVEAITQRLESDRRLRLEASTPENDIFRKTAALIAAVRKIGCIVPEHEETIIPPSEREQYERIQGLLRRMQRGYEPKVTKCQGRILLEYRRGLTEQLYLRCEHYTSSNRDHFIYYLDETYDLNYLEAYFNEDAEEQDRIEDVALTSGYGPRSECTTVLNASSQRLCCRELTQCELVHLTCGVKVRAYEPLEEHRRACPWILVTVAGIHRHPIPLPEKTPSKVQRELGTILDSVGESLADLTPRRFLRHPVLKDYLRRRFPTVTSPTLTDLHISLANHEHLAYFIDLAKKKQFPVGTGWEGALSLKEAEDCSLSPEDIYIRRIITIPADTLPVHLEDEPSRNGEKGDINMIICMFKEGSRRLANAQYIQSDIGFKRVVGFYEFELAGFDRDANTSVVFCRIFLNRQTAEAHARLFQEIDDIVKEDTGHSLRWRHIHGQDLDDTEGLILQITADQHLGQAKGLGLYLQSLAQQRREKHDLHHRHRLLSSLTPYEHLHRVFRLCKVHALRNIHDIRGVTEEVRDLMRSLICMVHPDWEGTLEKICSLGGKAAT
ncbi:hypothetical protein H0H93_008916, partial [Arthromyces matolae]